MSQLLTQFTIFLFYFSFTICHPVDLWYKRKVISNVKGDRFGNAIDVANNQLVVGAPRDNDDKGTVYVGEHGVKISAPENHYIFGSVLATNEHYIVIVGLADIVYVYAAVHPYSLVTQFDFVDSVYDVAIDSYSTIVVGIQHEAHVFRFDGRSSWHREKTLTGGRKWCYKMSVSVYGDLVAVGLPWGNGCYGYGNNYDGITVYLYHKTDGKWQHTQTLTPHSKDFANGGAVKINKDRLVVLANTRWEEISQIFVYKFHRFLNLWIYDGNILDRFSGMDSPETVQNVDVQGDLIASPVYDPSRNTTVSTVYYKKDGDWMPYAHLTAEPFPDSGYPGDTNYKVRINGNYVYTSRRVCHGFGAVFIHDLSQIH